MSALTRERAEVDDQLRKAQRASRRGATAAQTQTQTSLLQRHAALLKEKTLLQQEEAARLDARRRDASDAVDRCREDLAAAREEQERRHLLELAAEGDQEARARLRS